MLKRKNPCGGAQEPNLSTSYLAALTINNFIIINNNLLDIILDNGKTVKSFK